MIAPGGGVEAFRTAADANIVTASARPPGHGHIDEDAEREGARTKAGVGARLYEGYPIRFWDHYLGPRESHLFRVSLETPVDGGTAVPVDLTPGAGRALDETAFDVLPDGSAVVTAWVTWPDLVHPVSDLVVIGPTAADRRQLTASDAWYHDPRVSPDGRWVIAVRDELADPVSATDSTLWLIDLADGSGRDLTPALDLWPVAPRWSADGRHILFTADRLGHHALLHVDLEGGAVRVGRGGRRGGRMFSPTGDGFGRCTRCAPVRGPTGGRAAGTRRRRRARGPVTGATGGRAATAGDARADGDTARTGPRSARGSSRRWAPRAEAPTPVALWIHGGPFSSWNAWHWRWNPHLLVDRGYAVVLPDPGLSTGYGLDFVRRGWGRWGEEPYTDLLAVIDDVLARPQLDATADGRDGRLVRRLHGQLDRRAYGSVPGHRDPRDPVGDARLPWHH